MRRQDLNPDLDFPAEVAVDELARLTRVEVPFLFVEVDGERRHRYAPRWAGRHAGYAYLQAFCEATVTLARTWSLGCRASQTVHLPGKVGRMRGIGGSRRWSRYHTATWAAVAVEGWQGWGDLWGGFDDSLVRIEDYRLVLPALRPTEDQAELTILRMTPRPRATPFPRRPIAGRAVFHRERIEKIRSRGVNDGIYRSADECFAEMTFEDLDD